MAAPRPDRAARIRELEAEAAHARREAHLMDIDPASTYRERAAARDAWGAAVDRLRAQKAADRREARAIRVESTTARLRERAAAAADALGLPVIGWRRGGEPVPAAGAFGCVEPGQRHALIVVCPDPVPRALVERCERCGRAWMLDWEAGHSPLGESSYAWVVAEERRVEREARLARCAPRSAA